MTTLKCPFCGSENVRKSGHSNGKQRYACDNLECSHKTFYAEYTYKDAFCQGSFSRLFMADL